MNDQGQRDRDHVHGQRLERLDAGAGGDFDHQREDAIGQQRQHALGHRHHDLEQALEELAHARAVRLAGARDEEAQRDREEDDRQHRAVVGHRLDHVRGDHAFDDLDELGEASGARAFGGLVRQAEFGTGSGLDDRDQDLTDQDREQAGADVVREGLAAEAAQVLHRADAGDARDDRRHHERHDQHLQQRDEDVRREGERIDPARAGGARVHGRGDGAWAFFFGVPVRHGAGVARVACGEEPEHLAVLDPVEHGVDVGGGGQREAVLHRVRLRGAVADRQAVGAADLQLALRGRAPPFEGGDLDTTGRGLERGTDPGRGVAGLQPDAEHGTQGHPDQDLPVQGDALAVVRLAVAHASRVAVRRRGRGRIRAWWALGKREARSQASHRYDPTTHR